MSTTTTTVEPYSGLDDIFYDVTLTDASTGLALTTGSVIMRLCTRGTSTALGGLSAASQTLTHQGAGRWTGTHDNLDIATAVATLNVGQLFDRVLIVANLAGRKIATCQRVVVADA
jgi:hypothetical protein